MSDEKYFKGILNENKNSTGNDETGENIVEASVTGSENDESYNTKKFIIDDKYKEDELKSYSHYSDYKVDDSGKENKEINFTLLGDSRQEDGEETAKSADEYFEKSSSSYYRDNLSSDDVRDIIKDEMKKNRRTLPIILSSFAFGLLGAALLFFLGPKIVPSSQSASQATGVVSTINIAQNEAVNTETAVYAKASPSVVGITTQVQTNGLFFGQNGVAEGLGSGVVISEDGYILTNSHVVQDGKASGIQVVFQDKSSMEAKLLWYEPEMDLAVIKVDAKGLTPIEIGDSSSLKVGEKTIAIGNPLGLDLQSTMTSGYISGLNRSMTMETGVTMDGLIQTDAAINAGNSGGALLNSKGQLIGINTAKASSGEGIGFAIPINTAKTIVSRIQKSGDFEPVVMGIRAVGVDYYKQVTGKELGVNEGIYIAEVVEKSPAEASGIKAGDVILEIDGEPVNSMSKLRTKLLGYTIGDTVKLKVFRDGVTEMIDLTFSGDLS